MKLKALFLSTALLATSLFSISSSEAAYPTSFYLHVGIEDIFSNSTTRHLQDENIQGNYKSKYGAVGLNTTLAFATINTSTFNLGLGLELGANINYGTIAYNLSDDEKHQYDKDRYTMREGRIDGLGFYAGLSFIGIYNHKKTIAPYVKVSATSGSYTSGLRTAIAHYKLGLGLAIYSLNLEVGVINNHFHKSGKLDFYQERGGHLNINTLYVFLGKSY